MSKFWSSDGSGGGFWWDYWSYSKEDKSEKKSEYDWKTAYKSRYRSSLGYSSSKLSESIYGYSYYGRSAFIKSKDSAEHDRILIEKTYKAARDLVVILDLPFRVSIQMTSDGGEMELGNYRRIFLPTNVLDDKTYTEEDRISICSGQAIHEAAHLKYTEAGVLNSVLDRVGIDSVAEVKADSLRRKIFLRSLINIIEDERVESLLLQERPGYIEFIDKAKTYQYKEFIKKKKSTSGKVTAFLNNLYRLIRYPEGIEDEVLENYSEYYQDIKNILTPLPETTKDSCISAYKIYRVILKVFKDLELTSTEIDAEFNRVEESFLYGFSEVLYGFDKDLGINPSRKRVYSALEKSGSSSGSGKLIAELVKGVAVKADHDTYFRMSKGKDLEYKKIVKEVSPHINAIKKIIETSDRNYEFNIHGCRSGLLDEAKIAEAYQGVPQVYLRKGKVETSKSAVCVLIDESGSMSCNGDSCSHIMKIDLAKKAAILIQEALKGTRTDLYIYGHTADCTYSGSTEITVYHEKNNSLVSPYALSEVSAKYENRDGTAIFEVAKRVRSKTDDQVLMFVLSDGEPCAHHYYGRSTYEDVRKNVKKAEDMGFTVIQVTIDTLDDFACKDMFTNVVHLEKDLGNLPKELGKVIKKAILKDRKTDISL